MELPIFPLHTVLFPGMPIRLRIFEPRYRIMIRRSITKNLPFGIVLIRNGHEAGDFSPAIYSSGCTAVVVETEPVSDNSFFITGFGSELFKINEIRRDHPYLVAEVETYELIQDYKPDPQDSGIMRFLIQKYLKGLSVKSEDASFLKPGHMQDLKSLSFAAASILQIPSYEKQGLLELKDFEDFHGRVYRLLRREITLQSEFLTNPSEELSRLIHLN